MIWVQHFTEGLKRVNHAAVAIENRIFTFGGYCDDNSLYEGSIEVHVFNTDNLLWHKIEYDITFDAPENVYGHTAVAYNHLIYVFGGTSGRMQTTRLFCFNTEILGWIYTPVTGRIPPELDGHSACVIEDHMYIFGGFNPAEFLQDKLYRINLKNHHWELLNTSDVIPSARDFHTASAIGENMYVFGGRLNENTYENRLWRLNTRSLTWDEFEGLPHIVPEGRRSHSAVVYNGEIYIFGGLTERHNSECHLNDLLKFSPNSLTWSIVKAGGEYPSPRRRHCSVLVKSRMFMFGGTCPAENGRTPDETGLIELCDMHILEINPTLKRMCQVEIVKCRFVLDSLPFQLQKEIEELVPHQYSGLVSR